MGLFQFIHPMTIPKGTHQPTNGHGFFQNSGISSLSLKGARTARDAATNRKLTLLTKGRRGILDRIQIPWDIGTIPPLDKNYIDSIEGFLRHIQPISLRIFMLITLLKSLPQMHALHR